MPAPPDLLRFSALLALAPLAACKPSAADGYIERAEQAQASPFASAPLPSPDTTGATWARTGQADRIIYGVPGRQALAALACKEGRLELTRSVPADRGALAFAALVGNSHVARIPVDAVPSDRSAIWQGTVAADHPGLEALTGAGPVELTIPGAGTVVLNPSPLPGQLVLACRQAALPLAPAPPASPQ